jgi:hypothetical protein
MINAAKVPRIIRTTKLFLENLNMGTVLLLAYPNNKRIVQLTGSKKLVEKLKVRWN